jgi:hypothetical protein
MTEQKAIGTYTNPYRFHGSNFYGKGTIPMQASIIIPAGSLNSFSRFNNAYISAGATNPKLTLHPVPIKIVWSLQENQSFSPK